MAIKISVNIQGDGEQRFDFSNPPYIIGSLLSSHIIVRQAGVDPIHALIEHDEGQYTITDLDSETGVFVNGKKIEVSHPLKLGDQISIGSAILSLIFEEDKPAMPVVPFPVADSTHTHVRPAAPQSSVPSVAASTRKLREQKDPSEERTVASAARESSHFATTGHQEKSGFDEVSQTGMTEGSTALKQVVSPDIEDDANPEDDVPVVSVNKSLLFSPRKARPSGQVLEAVAYWGDVVLDIDFFHPSRPGFEAVTIGDPEKAHFIAAGEKNIVQKRLAIVGESKYKLQLLPGMTAKVRRDGHVESLEGPLKVRLGRRDIAHVRYGSVRYFLIFINPPKLDLPPRKLRDPFLVMLSGLGAAFFALFMLAVMMVDPKLENKEKDDIWAIVQLPTKPEKPITPPVPKIEKPVVDIQEVKQVVQAPTPPPPKPKVVQPAKPTEVEKPKQLKPVENPVEKPTQNATAALTEPQKVAPPKAPNQPKNVSNNKAPSPEGMASTGAKNPDFKKAGPVTKSNDPKSGGAKGSGMGQTGGERKGNQAVSVKGVEGVNNNQASGVNLDKLGLGVGKILSKTAPGAIATNFRSSAGGAGGGSGSGSRTVGLGGVGSGASLGISGSGDAVNNFGSGAGGLGSGQGGTGGLGGAGIGRGFGSGEGGRGRANVTVPSEGPVVSGGLTRQEILQVIRANLNQIRHCYEQLLQRQPGASGKIAVNFQINASGGVSSVSITDSNISDSVMRGCVTGRIQRWGFPAPRGASSVDVNYPFVFSPL